MAAALTLLAVALGISLSFASVRARLFGPSSGSAPSPVASRTAPSVAGSPPSAATAPSGTVSFAFVGDTMLGNTPVLPPSPATYLSSIGKHLRGNIVFGNLEGTLTDSATSKCPTRSPAPSPTRSRRSPSPSPSTTPSPVCYAFRVPPSYASYLSRAGFTVMNMANNHSFDFGLQGALDTQRALDRAGVAHEGLPGQIAVVRTHRINVAVVGFAPYTNTASLLDLASARALIRRAGAEADVVVVYMHAGAEGTGAMHVTGREENYTGEDRGNPEAFAHMAVRAGADLVVASGPHVLRGMEFYRGRLIAYSLGDFAGYRNFSTAGALGVGCVLHVRLGGDGEFLSARLDPLRLSGLGRPYPDPSGTAIRLIRLLSRQDLGARAARVSPQGGVLPPH